ncbi:MAG: M24 family metallopeptidase [Rhodospirillales bacterium]|nr:MAG: M24 family metallopeptidase [Rhodospirillales bacterium]
MLPFGKDEYLERIENTKLRMMQFGLDVLLVSDPANMNYLTGYDGWSFYTPQAVVVALALDEPICIVRGIDLNGAKVTTHLDESNLIGYPDEYVQNKRKHPMDFVAEELEARGLARGTIGVEMDAYFFTAACAEALQQSLPNATFKNAYTLVNWIRMIKSPQELAYMRQAARILEKVMAVAIEAVAPGRRQCDAAAEILAAQARGTAEFGGDYTAIVPMLPSGIGTSTPHLTWSDQPFARGEATILELAGCRMRYHCPQARTVFLGAPPQRLSDAAKVVVEGLNAVIGTARPGVTCEEVEGVWRGVIAKAGIVKDSRIGYSCGLNYPPDWGEHTISLRPGDKTVLQPDMTIHVIPGIWQDDWGIEISECIHLTETGAEPLARTTRELIVKD